jgi:hypothetical protein
MPAFPKNWPALFPRIDRLLRGNVAKGSLEKRPARIFSWILILLAAGCAYGAVMGAFGGIGPSRFLQIFYSSIKVPFLLLSTFVLSLPSFFVVNSLMGLRDDFSKSIGELLSTQAALTVILASLAPFTAFWYLSVRDYSDAILFNAAMFALASSTAQIVLRRNFRDLIQRNPRHRWMLWIWLTIYSFVGIQMGWVLRPFIGNPNLPTRFLRPDAWSNAYVLVGKMIWAKLR